MSFGNTYINNTATCAGGAIFGEHSAIQSASDTFQLNSEGGSNGGCKSFDDYHDDYFVPGEFLEGPKFGANASLGSSANAYLESSVFEYCKSPIPEMSLDINSVAIHNCV